MKSRSRFTFLALLTSVSLVHADSAVDRLRTQETRQQQVLSQTQQIGSQIDAIIAEFDRNGLGGGQDVKTLRAIRAALGQMSADQMQKVVGLLQEARGAGDGGLNDEKQAFLAQQGILGQFRTLLAEYEKQQSLYALADRFDRLAKRQAANLRSTVDLAQASSGKTVDQFDAAAVAALQTQQSEQAGITDDAKDALAACRFLLTSAGGTDADQLNKALAQADDAHVDQTLVSAAADLQSGNLFRSAGEEKNARDALRSLADLLAPPKDALTEKKDQLSQIESALQKQKEIADHARTFDSSATAQRQVDRAQAANVDDTDQARQKLQALSPSVAQTLKQAETKMQQTRGDLAARRRDQATPDATSAADTLKVAKDALEKEIAKDEADAANNAPQPGDKLAQTKELLDQVKQLRDEQKQLATADPATKPAAGQSQQQQSLAQKAKTLEQQATAEAPAAAAPLNQASGQMDQASQSLAKSDQPSAATQQKAADDQLAKAQDGLQQQADQLQKAQDQLGQLQQAQQQVAELMKKQADAAMSTAESGKDAQPKQEQVAQQTGQTQVQLPAQAQQAADALKDAQQQMNDAAQQIQKSDTPAAQTAQAQAMTNLGKAAVALGNQMDQLKTELGQPTDDPAAAQAAEDALNQAQQQLQTAQGEIAKAEEGHKGAAAKAEANLNAAAQAAAQAMGQQQAQAANNALQQAIAQMNQAGSQTKDGHPDSAQQSANAAAAALAKAQAALAGQMAAKTPSQLPADDISQQPSDQTTPGERAAQQGGSRAGTAGAAAFVGLPPRERAALQQSQAEKYPQEYGNMVQQYLQNLSDPQQK